MHSDRSAAHPCFAFAASAQQPSTFSALSNRRWLLDLAVGVFCTTFLVEHPHGACSAVVTARTKTKPGYDMASVVADNPVDLNVSNGDLQPVATRG